MKLQLYGTICCMLTGSITYAQSNWLPPANFPNNTDICDNTGWKLVLYDDFNGTALDQDKWIRYVSWDGMPGGDNEDTHGARKAGGDGLTEDTWNGVYRDQNVVVSNGACKLLIKHEPVNWHCASCPDTNATRYYSAGMIATRYHNPGGNSPNYFNAGTRFEVRMQMPSFVKAHTTVWTWYGVDPMGVNEIDMAEAYGPSKSSVGVPPPNLTAPIIWRDYKPHNTYSTHAWGPDPKADPPIPNPLGLPHDAGRSNMFFNQDWTNTVLTNNYHMQSAWHTYRCDWDSTLIRFYLDDNIVKNLWKYYKNEWRMYYLGDDWIIQYQVQVGTECNASGTNHVKYAFPYKNNSECNFRITAVRDGEQATTTPTSSSTQLGFATIDYVKIWQRHPEQDGHDDICAGGYSGPTPVITSVVKTSERHYTATITNPVAGATWSGSTGMQLLSSTSTTASFYYAGNNSGLGHIYYHYGTTVPGCPPQKAQQLFSILVDQPGNGQQPLTLINAQIPLSNLQQFYFACLDHMPDRGLHNAYTTYDWTIKYCLGTDTARNLTTYRTKGKFASTPFLNTTTNGQYYIDWKVEVKSGSDVAVYSGVRTSQSPLNQQVNKDHWYFDALITDSAAYENAVYAAVENNMVGEDADSIDILSMINQIRVEELDPYRTTKRIAELQALREDLTLNINAPNKYSELYPNPANNLLYITLGQEYLYELPVSLKIYNLMGQLQEELVFHYRAGHPQNIDISSLPPAMYFIEITQGNISEQHKLIKK